MLGVQQVTTPRIYQKTSKSEISQDLDLWTCSALYCNVPTAVCEHICMIHVRAEPGKRPWWGQYRNITPKFWSLDLKFWHVISNRLSKTFKIGRKKIMKKMSYYGRPKIFAEVWGGEECIFIFFFSISLSLFLLASNQVAKFQVLTSNVERCMAKFQPKCLCIQIYIYFRDSSISFERTWPIKLNAYVPTPRPKMYMPGKIEPIPSTLYFEQF